MSVSDLLRDFIQQRSGGRCEYCHFPERLAWLPYQVDHIIALQHGGPTEEGNLCWSCRYCNLAKGPNLSGWIRETNEIVRLFHPRDDQWSDHFRWEGALLMPTTKTGRVTIFVLQMNAPDLLILRGWMIDDGYVL